MNEYTAHELEDHAFCIQYLYRYAESEDKKVLSNIYDKICDWVNSNKTMGTVINPAYLRKIDKGEA